jgi:predicted metalloendopeptidase
MDWFRLDRVCTYQTRCISPHLIMSVTAERFLWWSVFSTLAPMTRSAFRELGFEFSRAVFGLQQRTPRWKSCTANVNANFGVALSYLYVKRHFDKDSRQKVRTNIIISLLMSPN